MKSFFVTLLLLGAVNSNAANNDKKGHRRMSSGVVAASMGGGGLSVLHIQNKAKKAPALAEERGGDASFLPKQNCKFSGSKSMGRENRASAEFNRRASTHEDDGSDGDDLLSEGFMLEEKTGGKGKPKRADNRYIQLEFDKEAGSNGCGVEIEL